MATSKEKFHILCNIQQYIQQLMIDCPIASEEEVKEGVLDNYGVLYSADGRKLIKANEDLTTYIIKPGTKIICDSAFCDCRLLRVVNIPESVEIIGHSAFCRCSSLNSVLIPSSVKEIGSEAFWYCSGISFVNYPSLTYIPDGLFVACDLSDFEIPKSVYVLEASCFASSL